MKTRLNVAVAAPLVALAGLTAFSTLQADEAVTDPVGYSTYFAKSGSNMFVPGFVNKVEFQGLVESTAGSTITVPQGLTPNAFNEGTHATHFVEVTESGDPGEGVILNIVSNDEDEIVTDATPAELTALALTGKSITVRAHLTLQGLFQHSTLSAFADFVDVFDDQGQATSYTPDGAGGWIDFGTFLPANDVPLLPGQGVVMTATEAKDVLMVGHVKTTPTRVSAYASIFNLGGQVNPLAGLNTTLGDLGVEPQFAPFTDFIDVFSTEIATGNLVKDGSYTPDGSGGWIDFGTFLPADDVQIDFSQAYSIVNGSGSDKTILLPRGW
jgi:hypothetical protein